ncbi:MAG: hypothetical protein ILO34_06105 [Kiritimatiellae bacterium]|nr:hypothetical protein [Kiritimatiellia bacterium]
MGRIAAYFAAAVLVASGIAGQAILKAKRPGSAPALAEGLFAAMGGLRSIAAEIVWFRADRLQESGRYVELAQLASTLAMLEPHTPEVWSYAAWNLAYNVSVMMPTHEDRWRWVSAAISLLRDKGLKYNPREAELYRELAWMFEVKIGADIDSAAPVYREKWKETMERVVREDAWEEVGMDRKIVEYVSKVYGIDDWTDPQASAIYWATLGTDCAAKGNNRAFLLEIIRQAKIIYDRNHGNLIQLP